MTTTAATNTTADPAIAEYRWLTGGDAERWLAEIAAGRLPLHRWAARLRREHSAERTHLLLEQVELRRRAAEKFTAADRMFFTRLGLEQATDQWVAAYKARRFGDRGGDLRMVDLCCGVGGDLLALALHDAVTSVTGIDRSPVACLLAAVNTERSLSPDRAARASAHTAAAAPDCLSDVDAWHVDPDRRPRGRRTSHLEISSPPLETIEKLLAVQPDAAVKLAPAADVPDGWQDRCEGEWISRDGQCRQLVVWHGRLARNAGYNVATILRRDHQGPAGLLIDTNGCISRTLIGQANVAAPQTSDPAEYLFEPDPAVLAAGLTGELAVAHGLTAFGASGGWLTGSRAIDDLAMDCFAIQEDLPVQTARLGRCLEDRGIGPLEIKSRGGPLSPEQLRARLKLCGDKTATLIMVQIGRSRRAFLTERINRVLTDSGPG